jgi:hypothetical protein
VEWLKEDPEFKPRYNKKRKNLQTNQSKIDLRCRRSCRSCRSHQNKKQEAKIIE